MKKILFVLAISLSLLSNPVRTGHAEAQLISEVSVIKAGEPFTVGLYLKLDPHWHVYWINPGDAGLPTEIDWQLPDGFSADSLQFPYPEKVWLADLANFGYEGEVMFPVVITPPTDLQPDQDITLSASASWLICKEECLPENADLELTLPVAAASQPDPRWSSLFSDTRFRLPLTEVGWTFEAAIRDTSLIIVAQPPEWFDGQFESLEFFAYPEGDYLHNAGEQILTRQGDLYQLQVPMSGYRDADPSQIEGILVADNGWRGEGSERAVEIGTDVGVMSKAVNLSDEVGSVGLALLFAFMGGMILNLMPCVLPILSIKILGFVEQAGQKKSKGLRHGAVFTLGVLVSFWVLAGLLLALRAGGEQLGWGFQLQSPAFVIVISTFLFLFGLSLFGVFEIGTSLMGVGQQHQGSGDFGAFMGGVTATIVTTPCTAPFMGSALGYTLSQPAMISMLVFTALGLGMAFPYMVLAASPGLLKFVPRPGAWMETLKQSMGFLLMATVIWLAWVLGIQTGADGIVLLLVTLLAAGMAAWMLGKWGHLGKSAGVRRTAITAALLIIAGGVFVSLSGVSSTGATSNAALEKHQGSITWEPYSPQLISDLRAAGKPVFIDFTAAWCLSCQANKKIAFGNAEVQAAFQDKGITTVMADWTSRDATITKALAEFGRNSVPLYVLYDRGADQPVVLPEILTPGIVLEALEIVE